MPKTGSHGEESYRRRSRFRLVSGAPPAHSSEPSFHSAAMPGEIGPPDPIHTGAEVTTGLAQTWEWYISGQYQFQRHAPRGDGSSVMVIPGLVCNDSFMAPLRKALQSAGHFTHRWHNGMNTGLHASTLVHLEQRLERLYDQKGPLKIVGHSLGGVYARLLAHRHPEKIQGIVMKASPVQGLAHPNSVALGLGRLYQMLPAAIREELIKNADEYKELLQEPLSVPAVSIYTRRDGVVNGLSCLDPHAENIEVHGSHIGIVVDAAALLATADRLHNFSLPEHKRKPFNPAAYQGLRFPQSQLHEELARKSRTEKISLDAV